MDRENAIPPEALTGSLRDFREIKGANLLGRVDPFFEWQNLRRRNALWPYSRSTATALPRSPTSSRAQPVGVRRSIGMISSVPGNATMPKNSA